MQAPIQHLGKVPVASTQSTNTLDPRQLDHLLHSFGIASEFIEFSGNIAHIPLENRLHVLGAMGVTIGSPAHLEALLAERELRALATWLPPALVLKEGDHAVSLVLELPELDLALQWRLAIEAGEVVEGACEPRTLPLEGSRHSGGRAYEQRSFTLPRLPLGYHRLRLQQSGGKTLDCLLIVAPAQTWQPQCLLQEGRRLWGLSTQLYSLRSADNWGMGDFADLLRLITATASYRADFILLNPLHALDLRFPENASPYSPGDRRFLNPLYIAPGLCEDFQHPQVQEQVTDAGFRAELARLRATDLVDYPGVHRLKLGVLATMYRCFLQEAGGKTLRLRRYTDFERDGAQALRQFAHWQAAQFAPDAGTLTEPGFHVYLEWLAQSQLELCQQTARKAGMDLGLIRDLAVGSRSDGCEVLSNPGLFCLAARIGAPPDNFNPEGQNWGLPPLLPERLAASGFAHFIALLRSNMQACGALRIDHVMALMRLWWCPDDGSNAAGAYVHYPVEALFAILRLESRRNRCVVIGEDLGVVPPEIRAYLDQGHIYTNAVFYFEKYDGWHFRKPEHYPARALAMIANHDVPPLAAWWNGRDLDMRRRIGLIPDDGSLQAERDYRGGERGQLLQWLAELGLLPAAWQDRDTARALDATLLLALIRACARVRSRLLSLQVDDLAGADTPVNIPGTSSEYANWQRKIPLALEELFTDTVAQAMLQTLKETRGA